jgi:hypothetical protein
MKIYTMLTGVSYIKEILEKIPSVSVSSPAVYSVYRANIIGNCGIVVEGGPTRYRFEEAEMGMQSLRCTGLLAALMRATTHGS